MKAKPLAQLAPVSDYFGFDEIEDDGCVRLHVRRFSFLRASQTVHQARVSLGKQALVGFTICNVLCFPFGFFWQAWLVLMVMFGSIYVYVLRNKTSESIVTIDPQIGIIRADDLKLGPNVIDWADIRSIVVIEGKSKAYFSRWMGKPKTQPVCAVLIELESAFVANGRKFGPIVRLFDGIDPRTANLVSEELMEMQSKAFRNTRPNEQIPTQTTFSL